MAYSQEQIDKALETVLGQGASYEDVLGAAGQYGLTQADVDAAYARREPVETVSLTEPQGSWRYDSGAGDMVYEAPTVTTKQPEQTFLEQIQAQPPEDGFTYLPFTDTTSWSASPQSGETTYGPVSSIYKYKPDLPGREYELLDPTTGESQGFSKFNETHGFFGDFLRDVGTVAVETSPVWMMALGVPGSGLAELLGSSIAGSFGATGLSAAANAAIGNAAGRAILGAAQGKPLGDILKEAATTGAAYYLPAQAASYVPETGIGALDKAISAATQAGTKAAITGRSGEDAAVNSLISSVISASAGGLNIPPKLLSNGIDMIRNGVTPEKAFNAIVSMSGGAKGTPAIRDTDLVAEGTGVGFEPEDSQGISETVDVEEEFPVPDYSQDLGTPLDPNQVFEVIGSRELPEFWWPDNVSEGPEVTPTPTAPPGEIEGPSTIEVIGKRDVEIPFVEEPDRTPGRPEDTSPGGVPPGREDEVTAPTPSPVTAPAPAPAPKPTPAPTTAPSPTSGIAGLTPQQWAVLNAVLAGKMGKKYDPYLLGKAAREERLQQEQDLQELMAALGLNQQG